MFKNIKPLLPKEDYLIKTIIKKKKVDLLVNYLNSFSLSENNKNKSLKFLSKIYKKNDTI